MVDVEHGALGALEQHAPAVADGLIQKPGGIAHQRADAFRKAFIAGADGRQIEFLVDAQRFGDGDFFRHDGVVLGAEEIAIQEVGHADAAAGDFILIAGSDPARGGSDGDPSGPRFGHFLHHAMGRKQHVRAIADQKPARDRHAGRFQGVDFGEQRRRIDDQSIADDGLFTGPQDSARNQLQDELLVADKHGVAGIVSALIARHNVEAVGEKIDNLAFTLVSPLGSQDDNVSHFSQTHSFYRVWED